MESDMMSEKPNAAACSQTVIAPEEYEFSAVPKNELLACLLYEYARESRAARNEITGIRRQSRQRKGKAGPVKFGPRVQNWIHSHILMSLSLLSGFPGSPWQRLSDKDKESFLKHIAVIPSLM